MPVIIEMPSLSPTMEKGNLVKWCKNEGDYIDIGDIIAEIDTDKATMEVESTYKGTLEKILVSEGSHDVLVKTKIAIIRQKNDSDEDIKKAIDGITNNNNININNNSQLSDDIIKTEESSIIYDDTKSNDINNTDMLDKLDMLDSKNIKISPLAKRIANDYGIDINKIIGSGPGGRIIKNDILNYNNTSKNISDNILDKRVKYIDEEISNLRKVIAEKLTKSKNETPHFYMNKSVNVTDLLNIRKKINESGLIDTKITVNDLIIKAVALSLKSFPYINKSWHNGKIRKYNTIDISVAVSVEDGLFTPIIENADRKSLSEISKEIKNLAKLAKEGKLLPHQFIGGSITISNLGMYNIDSFSSIINPPQSSILSIGPAKITPIYNESQELIKADIINIGYAVDHRVIDGAVAARFLDILSKYLESPILLII